VPINCGTRVYGELLGAAYRLRNKIHDLDSDTRQFLGSLADAAAVRHEPDQGIWEFAATLSISSTPRRCAG